MFYYELFTFAKNKGTPYKSIKCMAQVKQNCRNFINLMKTGKSVILLWICSLLAIPSVYAQDPPNKNEVLSLMGFPMGAPNEWEDPTNSNPYGEGVKNINPFHELAMAGAYRLHMWVHDSKKSSGALTEKSLASNEFSKDPWASSNSFFTNGLERIWAGDFTDRKSVV